MQRYKLTIAYRGTRYHGWQHQAANAYYKGEAPPEGEGIPTIQETVSRAIVSVVRHPIELVGSSRTDAGVHAKGQLAHFDTDQVQIPVEGLLSAVNSRLPEDILVRHMEPVPSTWDAIASTLSKRYQYFIWNAPDRPVFFADMAFHRWQRLDIDAMRQAAGHLAGTHDFASFAKPGHGRENTIRTLLACDVSYRSPRLVIGVEGTGFLWNMVRIIAGTLVEVGLGRYGPDDIRQMLAAKDRRTTGSTAPAHGLYLQWIKTAQEGIATRQNGPVIEAAEEPTIREYHGSDLDAIVTVAKALPQRFNGEAIRRIAIDCRYQKGYKAVAGGRVIGFISYFVDDGVATISWIGVLPEYQQTGLDRKLLDRVTADLRRGGVESLRNRSGGG